MNNPWKKIDTPPIDLQTLRVDANHPLDFFWAKDHINNYLFVYVYNSSDAFKSKIPDLEGVEIKNVVINDVSRLIFTLKEKEHADIFYDLCVNLVGSTSQITSKNKAHIIILKRLKRWQRFLKNSNSGILKEQAIKGLIGELLFLKEKLISSYGVDGGISAWIGPEGSPQDFAINDLAVEVKCQLGGSRPTIKISSADQLCPQLPKMLLYVVTLSKTTDDNNKRINLPRLISEIEKLIEIEGSESIMRFNDLLDQAGYSYSDKYNDFNYIFSDEQGYRVIDGFPRLIPNDLCDGIERINYTIKLNECKNYKIDLDDWELNAY